MVHRDEMNPRLDEGHLVLHHVVGGADLGLGLGPGFGLNTIGILMRLEVLTYLQLGLRLRTSAYQVRNARIVRLIVRGIVHKMSHVTIA